MNRYFTIFLLSLFVISRASAQIDPSLLRVRTADSVRKTMNMDAIYERPFIDAGKLPVSIGGYMEANWQYQGSAGVSEGHQFEFRRLTIFVSSTISSHIKFLTEIEFEPAEKEIVIEFAALDFEMHPLMNLRAGMILNPIGAFNQNHDGPKWEFTDRPIAMTQLLPATWSNAGFGIYGKYYTNNWMLGYELYASSGFDNSIVENKENKTFLPASKENPRRFEDPASGEPLITGKIAIRNNLLGELGISYMGGIYNKWRSNGLIIDTKRSLRVFALDFNTVLPKLKTFISAEWAWVGINVAPTYSQQFGKKQHGGYVDVVQPIVRGNILRWRDSLFSLACRIEYADWNVGKFKETNEEIGDNLWSVMPGVSFRPVHQTVIRASYRTLSARDLLGNAKDRMAAIQLGFSTYF